MDDYKEGFDIELSDDRIEQATSIAEKLINKKEEEESFFQNRFFEIVPLLIENMEYDTEEVLHDTYTLLYDDKYNEITETCIRETNILDILSEIIANCDNSNIQQESLRLLSFIFSKYPNTIMHIFENDFIFVIKEILTNSKNLNSKLIAFNVLIESSKVNELHSFFDDDEFVNFLDSFVSNNIRYPIATLLSELLKFVNFTNKKCLKIVCKMLIDLFEQNHKMGPLDVEIEMLCMQSLLNFIERGPIQQRFFLKQNILEYLTNKYHKLVPQAMIILFKMISLIFSVEDQKLLSRYNFLTKNTNLFIDSLKNGENELSTASLKAIFKVLERFPLFWRDLKTTKLNDFLIETICEKTYIQKNAAFSLLHLILKIANQMEIKEIYFNDVLINQLIAVANDEENERQNEVLDILEIFYSLLEEGEDYGPEIHEVLVEYSRIEAE